MADGMTQVIVKVAAIGYIAAKKMNYRDLFEETARGKGEIFVPITGDENTIVF